MPELKADMPMPKRDPMRSFWMDLGLEQKQFLLARSDADSDAEAARYAGISRRVVINWKQDETFRKCYDYFISDVTTGTLELLRDRVVMTAQHALDVWTTFLQQQSEDLTKQELERAKLAKDFIVEVFKRAPQRQELPRASGLPNQLDIEELTEETMNSGQA